jgi:hypothetical protein
LNPAAQPQRGVRYCPLIRKSHGKAVRQKTIRQEARKPRRRAGLGLAFALALSGAAGAAALGTVGYLLWPRWPGAAGLQAPTLPITVAGVNFNVPPAAIRVPLQRRAGAQARLDLAYLWPEFLPPQPGLKPALSDDPKPLNQLFITIANPQGALPLEERIKTIYPRYIAAEAFEGPAGLATAAFRDGTPYQGEDLFYEPQRPEHFLVRCTRNVGPTAGTCLLERQIGAAELTARFPRDWLGDWQHLSLGLDRLVEGLRAPGG